MVENKWEKADEGSFVAEILTQVEKFPCFSSGTAAQANLRDRVDRRRAPKVLEQVTSRLATFTRCPFGCGEGSGKHNRSAQSAEELSRPLISLSVVHLFDASAVNWPPMR